MNNHLRRQQWQRSLLGTLLTLALVLGALPGTAWAAAAPTGHPPTPEQRGDGTTTEDEGDEGAVASLEEVESAVVQIEAYGSFVDPEEGMMFNTAGFGSGFIIDESGIAVTNNHVVTGAAFLKVLLAGEDRPRSAKVLGVSECADLAVIDIEGDGFPYLTWYEDDIKVGLDVYAAGFPLGDPEFTLTRGIVSKARADGASSWASNDSVLMHDATINPGNSGGPLVTEDGRVVAVNYAGDSQTNQYFAISRDEALPLIERLRNGEDVNSIGINGEAILLDEETGGIWVASVESGSPADNAGIQAGDILISMEGLLLASDGTMTDYCNILRSHDQDDVLSVRVLRESTGEILTGQINGRPLEPSFVFGSEFDETVDAESDDIDLDSEESVAGYAGYTVISDDTGFIAVEVPEAWDDINSTPWVDEDGVELGPALAASADLDAYYDTWEEPGVFVAASQIMAERYPSPEDYLDQYSFSESCEGPEREEYAYDIYAGYYNLWENCGGEGGSTFINIAMMPETNDLLVLVDIVLVSEADLDALDHILAGLVVGAPSTPETDVSDVSIDTSDLIYDYAEAGDDAVSLLLPTEWSDTDSQPWELDGEVIGSIFQAAPDLEEFNEYWATSGLSIFVSPDFAASFDADTVLDAWEYSDTCDYEERVEHEHAVGGVTYSGAYDIWSSCGGTDTTLVVLTAVDDRLMEMFVMEFQVQDDADAEAFGVASQTIALASASGGSTISAETPATNGELATIEISDDRNLLLVEVPATWSEVRDDVWILADEPIGIELTASSDIEGFETEWNVPGIFFGVSEALAEAFTVEEVLDTLTYDESCTFGARFDYEDSLFVGAYDLWQDCGGGSNLFMILSATPKADDGTQVLLQVLADKQDAEQIFELIRNTFNINSNLDVSSLTEEAYAEATAESDESEEETPTLSTSEAPIAVVLATALNVRSGPGTNYSRIGGVVRDDRLEILGENGNCAWLQVVTPDGTMGWVSGAAQYVRFSVPCAQIPAVEAPAPPQSSGSSSSGSTSSGSSSASTANSSQGCYLFQNNINAELNITFTAQGRNWNKTFKVAPNGEHQECFDPGRYTYTLDAPPPWGSTNGELAVAAGDNFFFPIDPE